MVNPLALRELGRRTEIRRRIRALAFDKQLPLLDDPRKRKCIICSRRAGKTYGAALCLVDKMEANPGCKCMVFGLTLQSVKRIWWDDVLGEIFESLKLPYTINKSDASMTSPNGSVVYFMGADATDKEMGKALGQKLDAAFIDECGEMTIDLHKLCTRTLDRALSDKEGDLWMLGVPGDHIGGPEVENLQFFYAVTEGATPQIRAEWGTPHRWDTEDNPHMRAVWAKQLAEKLAIDPNFRETAEYIIEWTGRWYVDPSKLIYTYKPERSAIDKMPDGGRWTYVLGVDLGSNNATSFVLTAYREHDHHLYIERAYKQSGLDFDDVADHISKLIDGLKGSVEIVVDGANKQGVQTVVKRLKRPMRSTEKTAKSTYVRLMNTDLNAGRIKVVREACVDLTTEWVGLKRDVRAKEWKELESDPNDCADGALYAWRYARNYLADPEPPKKPHPDSEAAMDAYWEREAERVQAEKDERGQERRYG